MKTLREGGPVKRTQLAVATRLSYDALAKYVEWMNERGFIDVDTQGVVHLTGEGNAVYDRLVKWIMEYIGKVQFPRFRKP